MTCSQVEVTLRTFYGLLLFSAVLILLILAFTKRRKNCCQNCCYGRPGLITPVNLLAHSCNRLIYSVIFGAMSNTFISLALTGTVKLCTSGNEYGVRFCNTVISPFVTILLICLLYGPMFACVDPPIPLLGHPIGLCYTTIFFIITILTDVSFACTAEDNNYVPFKILSTIPLYVFYLILLVWYIYHIVNDVGIPAIKTRKICSIRKDQDKYPFCYVKKLLKNKTRTPVQSGLLQRLKTTFWVYEKGFRYPLKFLAPVVVIASILFNFLILGLLLAYASGNVIRAFRNNVLDIGFLNRITVDNIIYNAAIGFSAIMCLSTILSLLVCCALLFHMFIAVHKHLKLAAQGKLNFYGGKPPPHYKILVSSLKYGGYQIGYFVWAWVIYAVIFLLIGVLIGAVILLLVVFPVLRTTILGPNLFSLGATVVPFVIVITVQHLLCKFAFLERNTGGKFMVFTNRNAFSWFSYFFFLYNALVGIVGAMLRVSLSTMLGVLLLFRLDVNIMIPGFQFADFGNKVYMGFLYVEHTYNNPIVNSFVLLLLEKYQQQSQKRNKVDLHHLAFEDFKAQQSAQGSNRKKQVCRRWQVAYTLLNNPSLCLLRSSHLHKETSTPEMANDQREDAYYQFIDQNSLQL